MVSCTRCGHWHTDAEKATGGRMTCTEVKQFWSRVKNQHLERYGHLAQLAADENGVLICFKCKRPLEVRQFQPDINPQP